MSGRPSVISPPATGKFKALDDGTTSEQVPVGPGFLSVLLGVSAGKSYAIGEREPVLGRDPSCEVWLPEDDVSRRHAQVARLADGGLVVRDLKSTNGVRVNGVVVEEHRLAEGDLVMLGTHVVVLFSNADPSRSPTHQAKRLESLGRFAGGVAHDFSNLFATVLSGLNQLATPGLPEEAARRHRDEVRAAAEQGAALTQRLLIFAGAVPLERVSARVHDLVREAIGVAAPRFGPLVEVVRSAIPDELVVLGDPPLLRQVLVNILANAGEAIGKEVGQVAVKATAREVTVGDALPVAPGRYAEICIADTGCGMDERTRARIFEPFFTTRERDRGRGVGLGLAAAQAIAQQHGGCISVETQPGQGSSFAICLPLAPQRRYQTRERKAPGGCILIVDDDPLVLSTTSRLLTALGYVVLAAMSGTAALGMLKGNPHVGAAILDVNMPEMDGLRTLQKLLELRPTLPTLVYTGYPDQELAVAMLRAGADGVLAKPASIETLQRAVERLFAPR